MIKVCFTIGERWGVVLLFRYMSTAWWRMFVVLVLLVMMGNLLFLDWYIIREHKDNVVWRARTEAAENLAEVVFLKQRDQVESGGIPVIGGMTKCDSACQEEIERQVKLAVQDTMPFDYGGSTTTIVNSRSGTFYVPLGLAGSTTSLDWVNLGNTETEVNWAEYGSGSRIVTWEAYAKVFQGNGEALIRLYDVTNGVPVWGSEMKTGDQNFVLLKSGALTYTEGNVTYVVQAKTLTGYEAFVEGGKIKVVVR